MEKHPQQIAHLEISKPLQKLGQNTRDSDGIVRIQDRHMGQILIQVYFWRMVLAMHNLNNQKFVGSYNQVIFSVIFGMGIDYRGERLEDD